MEELMIKIDNVSKQYKLGQIGGTTLREELQRFSARLHGKEDPTRLVGAKDYVRGETFKALDGVSFEVKKGERVGIIGHNGAGKSTLLKLLSCVTAPTEGEIGLNGRVASMLEVGTGFHGDLTGRENIYMNGAILGMTRKEIDDKMEDIIDFSEVRQFIDTPVKRYSSGMYVKLAFSVAAHLDSEIMIMDEVLAVGDMAFQKKCLDKMNEVSKAQGRTILYVSHNMHTIRQLCQRVIVLEHGRVVFDGGVEDGIAVYMNNVKTEDAFAIDYTEIPRLQWLGPTSVRTLYAEYIGKTDIAFSHGEPMNIRIEWENKADVRELCLRVEIKRADRTAIGSNWLETFYSGKAGEHGSFSVQVDLSSLVSGKYTTNYTFFFKGMYGEEKVADCVDGLNFTLKDEEALLWNRSAWGEVLFPIRKLETNR